MFSKTNVLTDDETFTMTNNKLNDKLRIAEKVGLPVPFLTELFNVSEETKMEAIKRNARSIYLMVDPSDELQIAAVTKDSYAINYINRPCNAVKVLVKLME